MEERLTGDTSTVMGVFDDTYQAEQAIAELTQIGFREDQVDFVMSEMSTITGSYAAGGEPVLRSHEAGQAVVRVRAEGRNQEAVDLLHRYGAFDVRTIEEDEPALGSRGHLREIGSSGDRTVAEGSTGSAYDAARDTRDTTEGTPRRMAEAGSHNGNTERFGEAETNESEGPPMEELERAETWDEASPHYRSRWQRQYGAAGRRWEDYEPAYRFGWERSRMDDYRGRSWSEVESEFRSDWEQRHNVSPWDRIVDALKDAWESLSGTHERRDMDKAA